MFQSNSTTEINQAIKLYGKGFLPGPKSCVCGENYFKIYTDSSYKINWCAFRCGNSQCRKKYSITINSFYEKFSKQKLSIISEIIKCFLIYDFNVNKAYKYITEENNTFVSKQIISKVYYQIKRVISKYLKIEYQSNFLGELNANKYFSVDESLINHIDGKQVWLLGIIDNSSKDFHLEAVFNRDAITIKSFISKNVEIGNNIVSDCYSLYNYLDNNNVGYNHIRHIHGRRDFGIGIQSTSHVESIWAQIKSKLKESYHVIPPNNFMLFVREIEYKIKTKN